MSAITHASASAIAPYPAVGRPGLPFPPIPRAQLNRDTYEGRGPAHPAAAIAGSGLGVANGFVGGATLAYRLGVGMPLTWAAGCASGLLFGLLGAFGGGRLGEALADRRAGQPLAAPRAKTLAAGLAGGGLGAAIGVAAACGLVTGAALWPVAIVFGAATAVVAGAGAAAIAR